MSIYIEELENLRLYKRGFFPPIDKNDKYRGSAIFLLTPDFKTSKEVIATNMWQNMNFFKS